MDSMATNFKGHVMPESYKKRHRKVWKSFLADFDGVGVMFLPTINSSKHDFVHRARIGTEKGHHENG